MDTHIVGQSAIDPHLVGAGVGGAESHPEHRFDEGELRARLPGEEEPDPVTGAGPDPSFRSELESEQDPGVEVEAHDPHGREPQAPATERLGVSDPVRRKRRRLDLLLGVAAVALLGIGGGTFLISPYNHVFPMPGLAASVRHAAASAGVKLPAVLAPSASLASVELPPPAPPIVRPAYVPKPRDQQVRELLALGGQTTPSKTPVIAPAESATPSGGTFASSVSTAKAQPIAAGHPEKPVDVPPAGYVAVEPGSSAPVTPPPAKMAAVETDPGTASIAAQPAGSDVGAGPRAGNSGIHDLTSSILAALPRPQADATDREALAPRSAHDTASAQDTAQSVTPRPVAATVRVSPDPLTIARNLRAGPMTNPDQVQVLGLVTEIGSMVRDLRVQNAALRADMQRRDTDTRERLDDFGRRLALAEARNSVAGARDALDPATSGATTASGAPAASGAQSSGAVATTQANSVVPASRARPPVLLTRADVATPSAAPAGAPERYRVQAASPGLALLAQVDRGGGDGAQIQVAVGDSIPGYGKIKSIAQRGTAWVVATESGNIQ